VLIIDEAQMLSADVLEQLRLLTNLETTERKLLQIILIGQPELRTMLARPELEQLAQRVIARFHLKALSAVETQQYIQHRLSVSGMTRSMPFDRDSVERIHQLSRGIPRRINLLCDRAMLGAYARGTHRIGREIIAKAADEVFGRTEPPIRRKRAKPRYTGWLALGLALLAAAALYVGYVLIFDRGGRPSTAAIAASTPASAVSTAAEATPVRAASSASNVTAALSIPASAPASAAAPKTPAAATKAPASIPPAASAARPPASSPSRP